MTTALITLEIVELKARREAYRTAELRILESQEYKTGDGSGARSNRRANLKEVQAQIELLTGQITTLEGRLLLPAPPPRRVRYIR